VNAGIPLHVLNDGHRLPAIGFGCSPRLGPDPEPIIRSALDSGYRLLDTALRYGTESAVGRAAVACGLDRKQIIVTSKLPGRYHGYAETFTGFRETLDNLGLDHVDLYLIHWPLPRLDKYVDTWRAMIKLREDGLIRSIGVSNFTEAQLRRLLAETGVAPAVNQIELHPRFGQAHMRAVHEELGIITECWSPLGRGTDLLTDPTITAVASAHGRTPAQVILRWHVQLGAVPLPMSSNPTRQRQNLEIFDFELTDQDLQDVSGLETGRLWDQDPDTYEEF
jgi:diketogulonate reductase-like aldo/keto reductase